MRPMEPNIARNGLHILHEIFRLGHCSFEPSTLLDVVLIAIDFENISTIKSGFSQKNNCQVGLAVLDTKEINQVPPNRLISTHNFATGSPSYLAKASKKFIFREIVIIRPSDIINCIQSLIPPARNIVFVGHGIINDFQTLQALDFQFPALLSCVLDTFQVVNEAFQLWAGSLGDLLLSLGCSFNRLHCAGNDANFTLRALLLLAARGHASQQRDQGGDYDALAILQQISTCPIPHWVDPEVQALEKRRKRREKSRKHQSKACDKEKQEQIRSARKLKKEGSTEVHQKS